LKGRGGGGGEPNEVNSGGRGGAGGAVFRLLDEVDDFFIEISLDTSVWQFDSCFILAVLFLNSVFNNSHSASFCESFSFKSSIRSLCSLTSVWSAVISFRPFPDL